MIEYANSLFRAQAFKNADVRESGRYSAAEVRAILEKGAMCDLRQIGCPDEIFDRMIERRAVALGLSKDPATEALRERVDAAKTISVA